MAFKPRLKGVESAGERRQEEAIQFWAKARLEWDPRSARHLAEPGGHAPAAPDVLGLLGAPQERSKRRALPGRSLEKNGHTTAPGWEPSGASTARHPDPSCSRKGGGHTIGPSFRLGPGPPFAGHPGHLSTPLPAPPRARCEATPLGPAHRFSNVGHAPSPRSRPLV